MKRRILSCIYLVPLLVVLFFGRIPLVVLAMLLSFVAIREFCLGYRSIGVKPSIPLGFALTLVLYVLLLMSFFIYKDPEIYHRFVGAWIAAAIASGLAMMVFDKDHSILNGPVTSLAAIYIAYFMSYLVLTERLPGGRKLVWFCIICSWGADTFAYFIGIFFGQHKMAPVLSPKKTWEGSIGGIAGSVLLSLIFSLILLRGSVGVCVLLGALGAIVSEIGDLVASAFKRKLGIKDWSDLIPGHGGLLDRFDSVLFTAPFVYYFCVLFITKGF